MKNIFDSQKRNFDSKVDTNASLVMDPNNFSPHSFHWGGATFAFKCHVPAYLEMASK